MDKEGKKLTVVVIHGFGCTSLEFIHLIDPCKELEGVDRVFVYDRILPVRHDHPDEGGPRDAPALANELHALLSDGEIDPPYLLMGHSYGGLIAQHYALRHPREVRGLVLIDPAHEEQFGRFPRDFSFGFAYVVPAILKLYEWIAWTGILKLLDRAGLFNFPPTFLMDDGAARRECVRLYSASSPWRRAAEELRGCNATFDAMNSNPDIRRRINRAMENLPLALVIASDRRYAPTLYPKDVTKAFLDMHSELLRAGEDSGQKKRLFMANKSDHWIHLQQPELILDAVQFVLGSLQKSQNGAANS